MNVQWTLALRYLNGRKLRSFLTTLAVIFGALVIFGMNVLIPTMLKAFQATVLAASDTADLTVSLRSGETFSTSVLDTVRGVDGVRAAQGLLSRPINLPADFFDHNPQTPDRVNAVSLVGLDVETAQQVRNFSVKTGRFLQPGDTTSAVISQTLADNLGLKTGDSLPLPTTRGLVEFTIVGIRPIHIILNYEEVLVSLPEAQSLLDSPGKINVVEADYTPGDEAHRNAIQSAVQARLGDSYQFGALASNSDILANIRLVQMVFDIFGALALFMGGFIIFNTFRTLVAERRRDIGMLRALGANRGTIVGMVLMEGLLQGGIGSLAGIILGYLASAGMMAAVAPLLESIVHLTLGWPSVTPGLVAITLLIGVGVTLLAGLLPALSAGRVTPLDALRPAVARVEDRRTLGLGAIAGLALIGLAVAALLSGQTGLISLGAVLFLFGLILIAPALVRPIAVGFGALLTWLLAREGTGFLAQGNLTRQPTRTAITASTTMIALAILVVAGGLPATIQTTYVETLTASLTSDYLFFPQSMILLANNIGADSSFVRQMKAIDGVGPVSSMRNAKAVADVKPVLPAKSVDQAEQNIAVSLLGIDPAAYPQVSGLRFSAGTGAEAYPALSSGRNLIANGIFASTAGLKVGDVVPLLTPNGRQDYRVAAIGNDAMNIKVPSAYISQANLAADFGKTEDLLIQLNLAPGADRARVEAQLQAIKQQYPQFAMISGKEYYAQMTGLLNTAFAALYIVFIFLSIPSLIAMLNTLAISVIERTREIGMLRAIGATRKQVRRMIVAEALLLALVGTAFGLLGGLYLSYAMTGAFQLAGFPIAYLFPWTGLIYATLVSLLAGLLAAIIPARQAAQLEIVQALHYE